MQERPSRFLPLVNLSVILLMRQPRSFISFPICPPAIFQEFQAVPRLPFRLWSALKRDLRSAPNLVDALVSDIRDNGRIDRATPVLTHTVRVILREPAPNQVAKTVNVLLGNESVRLAIILYARSQGISITQQRGITRS